MYNSVTDYRTWSVDTCLICDIKNNEEWIPSKLLFSQEELLSELLYESEKFFIIADIGPIFEGYYLINYKTHVPAMAFLAEEDYKKLLELKLLVRKILHQSYGNVIFFEHGAKSFSRSAGCCIDHAHLHVVPLHTNIIHLLQNDFSFVERDPGYILTLKAEKEYLYYEDNEGKVYVAENIDSNLKIPTQYFRRLLANIYNQNTFWNWRDYVRYADLLTVKQRIMNARRNFKENLELITSDTLT